MKATILALFSIITLACNDKPFEGITEAQLAKMPGIESIESFTAIRVCEKLIVDTVDDCDSSNCWGYAKTVTHERTYARFNLGVKPGEKIVHCNVFNATNGENEYSYQVYNKTWSDK